VAGPFKRKKDIYRVSLEPIWRTRVRFAAGQLRSVLARDASADPAVARLYPAARPDDPLENLEYEKLAHDELASGREKDIETVERTADSAELTADELLAWMRVANDFRLVLGVRLDIKQDDRPFEPADLEDPTVELYAFLTWLVGSIVETIPV